MSRGRGGDQVIPRPDNWRPGPPPVWHDRHLDHLADLDAVVARLQRWYETRGEPQPLQAYLPVESPRPSAVLVGLIDTHDGASLILTRRTDSLSTHKGEIAFPGGRVDGEETLHDAALREAHEEIGVVPSAVRTIGELNPIETFVTRSRITPVVGIVNSDVQFVPAPAEVARVFTVPLTELVHEETLHNEIWNLPGNDNSLMHFYKLDGETLWGVTARMVTHFLDVVTA